MNHQRQKCTLASQSTAPEASTHHTSQTVFIFHVPTWVYLPTVCRPRNANLFLCLVISLKACCSFRLDAR